MTTDSGATLAWPDVGGAVADHPGTLPGHPGSDLPMDAINSG